MTDATPLTTGPAPKPPRLLDQVRAACRVRHYSLRTEDAYAAWVKRFVLFHGKRHPRELGAADINAYLTHLAVEGNVAASTQNQAFSALLFLYKCVLHVEPGRIEGVIRAKRPERLPVVLTRDEVARVLAQLEGTYNLIGRLLYGAGLRLLECLRLRVKDLDFAMNRIVVREGKGAKDRRTIPAQGGAAGLARPPAAGAAAARPRLATRLRAGIPARGAGAEAAARRGGLALAIRLPVG
jgi:site-specific recombinase XerD